ncbi:MAG TPA: PUA domain-containing protein [Nitrososphaeraceae archaeon]|jgi:uncharacterized protein with predicted RNA binding PUA domain
MIDALDQVIHHVDMLFNIDSASSLNDLCFAFSKRTGRLRSFGSKDMLYGTLRSDGGIALTIFGAAILLPIKNFFQNVMIPESEAVPFIEDSKSLFCKHVYWMGKNIRVGSEVAIVDKDSRILGVGKSCIDSLFLKSNTGKGVAVKVREGLKSRITK